jgi:glycosyltransferase involved in cell wall biosynthesis
LIRWADAKAVRMRKSAGAAPVVLETRVVRGSGGGPDKTILNSPRFLTPLGYRTVCAYLHPPGDPGFEHLRRKARAWQAPLISVADHGPLDLGVVPRLLSICRRERVAVWHGHDYKTNALGLLLRRCWRMRLITTVHGWVHHTSRTPLYYWIDRLCLPRYDLVICVSEDLRDRCLECGVRPDRCVLVENAIDTDEFRRRLGTAEARQGLGLPSGRFLVGAVGRLSAEKGFDVLIRAVVTLLGAGQDVGLVIVGEGDEEPRLRDLIAQSGAADRIQLLGYRPDVATLDQALDVFALSSYREGLPNVLLEAMALGVPVVATAVAGIPRLVRDGENGLLVEAGNVTALAGALSRLRDDTALRAQLGRAARQTVEARYSFRERMARIAALYDRVLNRPSSPNAPRPAFPSAPGLAGLPAGGQRPSGADLSAGLRTLGSAPPRVGDAPRPSA